MKGTTLFFIFFFISTTGFSQPSDFLIIKKGQHTIKSFFAGSNISFQTESGFYSGQINSLQRDSVFLTQFDIRKVPTNLGVYFLDTVATYRLVFNYRDIIKIENEARRGFNWAGSGGSLFGGGILITAVGLSTWIFTRPGTEYHASPALVISGAALAGVGYLLLRSNSNKYIIGRKYHLEYVKVK